MSSIRLLAGSKAKRVIQEQGLKPELFTRLLAASGGPKWLGIAGLDKYLFGTFLKDAPRPVYTLGASSGAWRLACLAQQNPLAAYGRLEEAYIGQRYDTKPSQAEVERQVQGIIQHILGDTGAQQLLSNAQVRSHFIVCRGRHLNRSSNVAGLMTGLALSAMTNLVSRRTLSWHFERLVFGVSDTHTPYGNFNDLSGRLCHLNPDNLNAVLQASGSIPLLLPAVRNIAGVAAGHYYDGGITDYHFDLDLSHADGLTLYPHFYPHMAAGWFDKGLKSRRATIASHNYDNALVLTPSPEFLARLPYGKVPDREDFKTLDTDTRRAYWWKASALSNELGSDLHELIETGGYLAALES